MADSIKKPMSFAGAAGGRDVPTIAEFNAALKRITALEAGLLESQQKTAALETALREATTRATALEAAVGRDLTTLRQEIDRKTGEAIELCERYFREEVTQLIAAIDKSLEQYSQDMGRHITRLSDQIRAIENAIGLIMRPQIRPEFPSPHSSSPPPLAGRAPTSPLSSPHFIGRAPQRAPSSPAMPAARHDSRLHVTAASSPYPPELQARAMRPDAARLPLATGAHGAGHRQQAPLAPIYPHATQPTAVEQGSLASSDPTSPTFKRLEENILDITAGDERFS